MGGLGGVFCACHHARSFHYQSGVGYELLDGIYIRVVVDCAVGTRGQDFFYWGNFSHAPPALKDLYSTEQK